MKKCPFCFESIQDEAIRCKHCGADISAAESAARDAEAARVKAQKNQISDRRWATFWGGLGSVLMLGLAYLVFDAYGRVAGAVSVAFAFTFFACFRWWYDVLVSHSRNEQAAVDNMVVVGSNINTVLNAKTDWALQQTVMLLGGLVMLPVGWLILQAGALWFVTDHFAEAQTQASEPNAVVTSSTAAPAQNFQTVSRAASDAVNVAPASSAMETPVEKAPSSSVSAEAAKASSDAISAATDPADASKAAAKSAALSQATAEQIAGAKGAPNSDSRNGSVHTTTEAASGDGVLKASFDCSKAASRMELLICSEPATADADKRLAEAYAAAQSKVADKDSLKKDERRWIKESRDACADAACLVAATNTRIQQLSALTN